MLSTLKSGWLMTESPDPRPRPEANSQSRSGVGSVSAQTFVNEIHYDNDGTDANERVEIAGPAGASLAGWKVVLYNGGNVPANAVMDDLIPAGTTYVPGSATGSRSPNRNR